MTTSTLELAQTLRDPHPPTPGRAAHAAVHARAHQLRRRHRAAVALTSVSCAALLTVGVVAVVNTGTSGDRVQTAAAPSTAAPSTAAPAPTDDTAPAAVGTTGATSAPPAAETTEPDTTAATSDATGTETIAAPVATTAELTVYVGEDNVPADVELDAALTGEAGTFSAHTRTPGTLAFADVPAGDYELRWSWVSDDGTAQAAGRVPVHVEPGDLSISL